MRMSDSGRVLPSLTPISEPFFAAAREGKLNLQHCPRDGYFFYPRTRCPVCLGDDWEWRDCDPKGTVYSYTIDRVGLDPASRGRIPLAIVLVDLDAGPRLLGNFTGTSVEDVAVGMRVGTGFEIIEDGAILQFSPL